MQGFSIACTDNINQDGWSVSGAGDVNGDGFADIIIGAPSANNFAGVSYVIYGGTSLYNIDLNNLGFSQGFSIAGAENSGYSGISVSGADDVNGDGFADIIIGACCVNNFAGASYVIYGGDSLASINLGNLSVTQGFSISGAAAYDQSGASVSGAGDINRDGFADVIIGAQGIDSSYVIYGNASPSNIDLTSLNLLQGYLITGGIFVGGAGDINSDGYADVIIGNTETNNGAGTSYVIYGNISSANINLNSLSSTQGFSIIGASPNDASGASVSGAGDVNKDGFDDVIIGAPNTNNDAGASYVIYGGSSSSSINLNNLVAYKGFIINGASGKKIVPSTSGDCSGLSVKGAGDVNGDGFSDVIIGAPDANNYAGISYVIYGGTSLYNIDLNNLGVSQGFSIIGAAPYDQSGYSVSNVGDINKDGFDDIIIGAYYANYAGTSYVIYGGTSLSNINLGILNPTQGFSIIGVSADDGSGLSVSGTGDVNGDGFADVIIGAPNANNYAGISYVIYGGTSLSNIDLNNLSVSQGFSIIGASANDKSGSSVSGAGDVNGDGFADVIIGAPDANNNAGISYVIYGGTSLSNIDLNNLSVSQGFYIIGASANDESGYSVSGAGDVNGDGYTDIIIGAPYVEFSSGISYVIYGGDSLSDINLVNFNLIQGFTLIGAEAEDISSHSVSNAGDINGDGYGDIIIGAYGINNNAGGSYIIFGQQNTFTNINLGSLNPTQGFSIIGNRNNDESGYYVSGAGDINGDGYDDIVIGAPLAYNQAGISYVIYGSSSSLGTDNKHFWSTTSGAVTFSAISFVATATLTILSRSACFRILKNWSDARFIYRACDFVYGHAYAAKKQAEDQRTASNAIEMHSIPKEFNQAISSNTQDCKNPLVCSVLKFSSEEHKQGDIESPSLIKVAENHATVHSIPNVHYTNPLLNHPQSAEIFKYAREIGGTKAVNTLLDYQGYISNDINEIKATIKEVFADSAIADQAEVIVAEPAPTADNMQSSISNNNLIIKTKVKTRIY